jgi:uncharacterized membrane protein YgcG
MTWLLMVLAADPQPPPEGRFIVDQTDGGISAQARADVDELALTVHAGGFGELMVLVVESTAGVPAAKYGMKVFAAWPVGHAENVDGALLVLARRDKTCALVLGDSFVGLSTRAVEDAVVAKLKDGKLDEAVRAGATGALRLLEGYRKGGAASPPPPEKPDAGTKRR